jgi:hypothetical protein
MFRCPRLVTRPGLRMVAHCDVVISSEVFDVSVSCTVNAVVFGLEEKGRGQGRAGMIYIPAGWVIFT